MGSNPIEENAEGRFWPHRLDRTRTVRSQRTNMSSNLIGAANLKRRLKMALKLNGIWEDRYGIFYKRNGEWVGPYQFLWDKEHLKGKD